MTQQKMICPKKDCNFAWECNYKDPHIKSVHCNDGHYKNLVCPACVEVTKGEGTHAHVWDDGSKYIHSHKKGDIPHGHHGSRYKDKHQLSDYDLCVCGDYRLQHENGTGKCTVCEYTENLSPKCKEFRLAEKATKIPEPHKTTFNFEDAKKL